jgi:hypothetical protein
MEEGSPRCPWSCLDLVLLLVALVLLVPLALHLIDVVMDTLPT